MTPGAVPPLYWKERRKWLQMVVDVDLMTDIGVGQTTWAIGEVDGVRNGTRTPPCFIWYSYEWEGRRIGDFFRTRLSTGDTMRRTSVRAAWSTNDDRDL